MSSVAILSKHNQTNLYCKITQFVIFILLSRLLGSSIKSKKSSIPWYASILVAIILLFWEVSLLNSNPDTSDAYLIFCILLMFSMLLALVYIYKLDQERQKRESAELAMRVEGYQKQYEQIKESYNTFNVLRHNLAEGMLQIYKRVMNGDLENLREHMDKILMDTVGSEKHLIDTNNVLIDCIVNARIKEAKDKGIAVEDTIFIPEHMDVDPDVISTSLNTIFDIVIKEIELNKKNKELHLALEFDVEYLSVIWCHPFENNESKGERGFMKRNKNRIAEMEDLLDQHHGRLYYMIDEDQIVWDLGIRTAKIKTEASDFEMQEIQSAH